MRYFTQGWNEPDGPRRSMLLDIATEELSHLEMVAQTLSMLLKGSPSQLVDQVEGSYLGELLDGHCCIKATGVLAMPESRRHGTSATSGNRDKPNIQRSATRPRRLPVDQLR
jgi:Mn-containing catalase